MAADKTKAKAKAKEKAPKAEKVKKERGPAMKPFLIGLPESFIAQAKRVATKRDTTLRGMFRELLVKGVERFENAA